MDMISGIAHLLGELVDVVTIGYRFAHDEVVEPGAATLEAAFVTWLVGTVFTFVALALAAFGCYAALDALRGRLLDIADRAARGLDLRRSRHLAEEYVRVDRLARILQEHSGVSDGPADRSAPGPFIDRGPGSRRSRLAWGLSRVVRASVALVRLLCTSTAAYLSFAATWWALGRPGANAAWERLVTTDPGAWRLTSADLSALGLLIAIATFALGRLRSVRSSGHHAWRKGEVGRAADELALREVAIDKAFVRLERALPEVHRQWLIEIHDRPHATIARIANRESELRRRLELPPLPLRDDWIRATYRRRGVLPGCEPQVKEAEDAIADLRRHLDEVTERNETAIRRYAPWGVVRVASRYAVRSAVRKIEWYVDGPGDDEPRFFDVEWYARRAAVADKDRMEILEDALRDWREKAEHSRQALEKGAHRAQLRALIGMAELRQASDRIFVHLHPTGPLRRMRDRLLPS